MKIISFVLVALGVLVSTQPSANIVIGGPGNDVSVTCYQGPNHIWTRWSANINAAQTLVLICEERGGIAQVNMH